MQSKRNGAGSSEREVTVAAKSKRLWRLKGQGQKSGAAECKDVSIGGPASPRCRQAS